MAVAMSSTNFHQPAARRPISFAPQIRFLLNPLSNEELIHNRSSLPLAPRDLTLAHARQQHQQQRPSADANAYIEAVAPNNHNNNNSNKENEDPIKMTTLIPLVLKPRLQRKRASDYLRLLDTSNHVSKSGTPPHTPSSENRQRDSTTRPGSMVYAKEDCERKMEEVKSLFGRRRFDQCASLCQQLLEDPSTLHHSQIQPLYTAYLCFYAAISLDQSARSLPTTSDMKRRLFSQSLVYYQRAKSSISSVSLSVPAAPVLRSRRLSIKSSSSSNRSSVDSLYAQFSLAGGLSDATKPTSPRVHIMQHHHRKNTSSTSSTSSIMRSSAVAAMRMQKKVSFSDSLPTFIDLAHEHQRQQQQQLARSQLHDESWDLIDRFPKPPSPSSCPSLMDSSSSGGESEDEEVEVKRSRGRESMAAVAAIERFNTHLKAFEGLLDEHVKSINTQVVLHDRAVRNLHASASATTTTTTASGEMEETSLREDLKKRIARRKAEKWAPRKKFDPRRYQDLCEKVLVELDDGK